MNVPEFEHQEYPENLAIVAAMDSLVLRPYPLEQVLTEVSALPALRASQDIERKIAKLSGVGQPDGIGKTKPVLGFFDDLLWEQVSHCLFKEVPQPGPSNL